MQSKFLIGAVALVAIGVIGVALLLKPVSPASGSTPSNTVGNTSATEQASSTTSGVSSAQSYTLADVAQHGNGTSCWAAINGNVYDLTNWINQHPGGPERILNICGTDATAAFNAQHANDAQPHEELTKFYIGTLEQQ